MQGLILSCMILHLHVPVGGDVLPNMESVFLLRQIFTFSDEKIGDYYTGVRRVLTKIFGNREVLAYVTATEKEHGTKRLFFSTIFPEDLQIFCAWQEKAPLNQTGNDRMKYIPLLLYSFRWNIMPIFSKDFYTY